jgi:hypothetical protein
VEVEYELTPDDLYHYQWRACFRSPFAKRAKLKAYLAVFFLFSVLTFLPALGSDGFEFSRASLIWMVPFFVVVIAMWLYEKRQTRRLILDFMKEEKPDRGQLGVHKISLNEAGLVESTAVGESRTSWAGIDRVEHDEKYIYIYTAPHAAHVIPKRAFNNLQQAESFYQLARVSKLSNAATPTRTSG